MTLRRGWLHGGANWHPTRATASAKLWAQESRASRDPWPGGPSNIPRTGTRGHGIDLGAFLDGERLTLGRDGVDERVLLAILNPVPLLLAPFVDVEG